MAGADQAQGVVDLHPDLERILEASLVVAWAGGAAEVSQDEEIFEICSSIIAPEYGLDL